MCCGSSRDIHLLLQQRAAEAKRSRQDRAGRQRLRRTQTSLTARACVGMGSDVRDSKRSVLAGPSSAEGSQAPPTDARPRWISG